MALNNLKCNHLMPLHFKGLNFENFLEAVPETPFLGMSYTAPLRRPCP